MKKEPKQYIPLATIVDVPSLDSSPEGERYLRNLVTAYRCNQPLKPETLAFLAEAFEKIIEGKSSAEKALKLQTKQGTGKRLHKRIASEERSQNIACMVEEKILAGAIPDEARQAVAEELGIGRRTVSDHHKRHELLARITLQMLAAKK